MRGHISSLFLSLFLSFCLWLSLAGHDTSSVDLTVPLAPHSLPGGLVIKGEMVKEVTLTLQANTAQVRFLADRKLSLPLDLSRAREGPNALPVLLAPLNLPRGVQVSEVVPGLVEFEALRVSSKTVPLKAVVAGQPDPAFKLEGVVLDPAEVTFYGPPEALGKLKEAETTVISVEGLTRSAVFTVSAAPPENVPGPLVAAPREIQAAVNIQEISAQAVFDDVQVDLEVKNGGLRGAPASFIARPARVSVAVSWPASRGRPVDAGEILARVSVDADQLKEEGQLTLPVVAVPPDGVRVTAIKPPQVNVSRLPSPPAAEGAGRVSP